VTATRSAPEGGVSEVWAQVLAAFDSVRAYLTDLAALAHHATRMGLSDPNDLTIRTLRSYLANQQTLGRARTTLARRATSARAFTAWLHRTGRAREDAGALLAIPKAHRDLPVVLSHADIRELLDATGAAIAEDGSLGLRDLAILEWAAAHCRHSLAGGRGRPAQRPGNPRPRLAWNDADLHAREQRTLAGGVQVGSSSRLRLAQK
jgi:hypothetical protein